MTNNIIIKANKTSIVIGWIFVIVGLFGVILAILIGINIVEANNDASQLLIIITFTFFPLLFAKLGHSMLIIRLTINEDGQIKMKRWYGDITLNVKNIKEWYIGQHSGEGQTQYYLVLRTDSQKEYAYPLSGTNYQKPYTWQFFKDTFKNAKKSSQGESTLSYFTLLELTL